MQWENDAKISRPTVASYRQSLLDSTAADKLEEEANTDSEFRWGKMQNSIPEKNNSNHKNSVHMDTQQTAVLAKSVAEIAC